MIGISKGASCFLAAAIMFGLMACHGPKPDPKPYETPQNAASPEQVHWTYMPGGITLNLTADKNLNPFEGFTHNLMLCTYQLSDQAMFQELAAGIGGIGQLLECNRFDQTVVHVERHFISPGQASAIVLDRAQGARYLGLVAGYNDLQPGRVTTLYTFPVNPHRKGWWPWSKAYDPGNLNVDIVLSANSIQRMGVE